MVFFQTTPGYVSSALNRRVADLHPQVSCIPHFSDWAIDWLKTGFCEYFHHESVLIQSKLESDAACIECNQLDWYCSHCLEYRIRVVVWGFIFGRPVYAISYGFLLLFFLSLSCEVVNAFCCWFYPAVELSSPSVAVFIRRMWSCLLLLAHCGSVYVATCVPKM